MGVKVADKFVAMGDFELLNAQDVLVDIKGTSKRLQEAIDDGELGNSSSSEETIDGESVKKFEIDNCGVKGTELTLLVDGEFTTTAGEDQEYPYYKITKSSGELFQSTRLNKATLYEVIVDDVVYKFVGEECFRLEDNGFAKGEFVGNSTMVNSAYYTAANTTNEDLDWVLIADTSKSAYLYIMTKEPRTVKLKVSQCARTVVPFFHDLIFGTLFDPFYIKADGSAYSNVSIAGANKIDTARRGVIAIGDCNVFKSGSEFNVSAGYGNDNKASNRNFVFGISNIIKDSSKSDNFIVGAGNSVNAGWSILTGSYCTIEEAICSSVMGYETECYANLSTAIGVGSKVSEGAECSTAIGKYVLTKQKGQVALGFGNKASEKNLFEIGNGKDAEGNYIYSYGFPKEEDITRDNAFEVTYDGVATAKTGIGVDDVTLTKEELTTLKDLDTKISEMKTAIQNNRKLAALMAYMKCDDIKASRTAVQFVRSGAERPDGGYDMQEKDCRFTTGTSDTGSILITENIVTLCDESMIQIKFEDYVDHLKFECYVPFDENITGTATYENQTYYYGSGNYATSLDDDSYIVTID